MIRVILIAVLVIFIVGLALGINVAAVIGIAYLLGFKLTLAQAAGIVLALGMIGSVLKVRHA